VDYYDRQGALRTVDGMAPIDEVAAAVGRALADAAFRPVPAQKRSAKGALRASSGRKSRPAAAKKPARGPAKTVKAARGGAKARRQPAKPAPRPARGAQKSKKAKRGRRLTK
jgi:hypothetical protein